MYRNARIYVADVLDKIVVEATVWESDWKGDGPADAYVMTAQCNSTGEEVPHEWLKDALITLIETL